MRTLQIMAASPGDVCQERELLKSAIDELNEDFLKLGADIQLRLLRWEVDVPPGFGDPGPQGLIDTTLRPDAADILICIFWRRFGTPIAHFGGETGTQHEIRLAREVYERIGRPRIMIYFCTRPYERGTPQEAEEALKVARFESECWRYAITAKYEDHADFERRVRRDLKNLLFPSLRLTRTATEPVPIRALSCKVLTTPRVVRVAGIAERAADLYLHCSGLLSSNIETTRPAYNVQLFVGTNITNRITNDEGETDAYLEPAEEEAGGTGYFDKRRLNGRLLGNNSLVFREVPLSAAGVADSCVLIIRNLRVNANQLGVSSTLEPTEVKARVVVNPTSASFPPLPVVNDPVTIALVQSDMFARPKPTSEGLKVPLRFSAAVGVNEALARGEKDCGTINFFVEFVEETPGTFRRRDLERLETDVPAELRRAGGRAVLGTRLRLVFDDIPAGVRLFVTATDTVGSGAPRAVLVCTDARGDDIVISDDAPPRLRPTNHTADGIPIVEVQMFAGCGFAVWECVGQVERQMIEKVRVGILVAAQRGQAKAGTAKFSATLAPISTVTSASPSEPIPRFADTSIPRSFFSIEE